MAGDWQGKPMAWWYFNRPTMEWQYRRQDEDGRVVELLISVTLEAWPTYCAENGLDERGYPDCAVAGHRTVADFASWTPS